MYLPTVCNLFALEVFSYPAAPFYRRLIEECRINRMRLEAVRQANNAAVLRQQVFHFDPNYYPYLNAVGGADPGNANFNGLTGAGQPASGIAAGQLPGAAASTTHSNVVAYAQDLHTVHPSNIGSKFPCMSMQFAS